jgi:hypothetical protein
MWRTSDAGKSLRAYSRLFSEKAFTQNLRILVSIQAKGYRRKMTAVKEKMLSPLSRAASEVIGSQPQKTVNKGEIAKIAAGKRASKSFNAAQNLVGFGAISWFPECSGETISQFSELSVTFTRLRSGLRTSPFWRKNDGGVES